MPEFAGHIYWFVCMGKALVKNRLRMSYVKPGLGRAYKTSMLLNGSDNASDDGQTSDKLLSDVPRDDRRMHAPETERFVALLKELLIRKGISQRELSRRLGIKIGTLTRYLKGDVNPYDVKLGIQRALTEECGINMVALYARLDGVDAPTELSVKDVSSWIRSTATLEDMATLFQSQQEAQLRLLADLNSANKTEASGWIPVDNERAEVMSALQNLQFEQVAETKGLSKRDAWIRLKGHVELFLNDEEVSKCHEVVFGMDTWPPQMLERIMLKMWPERCQLQQAFQIWAGVEDLPNCGMTPTSELKAFGDKFLEVLSSAHS